MITKSYKTMLRSIALLTAISATQLSAMNVTDSKEAKRPQTKRSTTTNTYIPLTKLFAEEFSEELIRDIKRTKDDLDNALMPEAKQLIEQQLDRNIYRLLSKDANINWPDAAGWTALHYAASDGLTSCLKTFIKNGAKLDQQTGKFSTTALHLAAAGGHLDCVRLLVEAGATIDITDSSQRRAYHDAIEHNHPQIVEYLLKNGASSNLKGPDGNPIVSIPNNEVRAAIQNGLTGRANWARLAILTAYMRANRKSTIKNSILGGLMSKIRQYADLDDQEEIYTRKLQQ